MLLLDLTYFGYNTLHLFIYLGFYVAFNTVQVISRRAVGRAEETSTYSSSGFCTVNCRPTASNYQLSHLRLCREQNLRDGRRECYHSATVAPQYIALKIPSRIIPSRNSYIKLILHLIICVYTRKCATNIIEKYEHSLIVG